MSEAHLAAENGLAVAGDDLLNVPVRNGRVALE
jgi:hypothetical protein